MAARLDADELRNDDIHRRVAARIRSDPRLIAVARARVEKAIASEGLPPLPIRLEWRAALMMLDPEDLAAFLESPSPRARRMWSSSPFFGLDR